MASNTFMRVEDVAEELGISKSFDDALKKYNDKQTRADRQINNYYEKIRSGKQEKPFHEIILQVGDMDKKPIGVWGQRRRRFLKENHKALYMNFLTSGKLNTYLADIDEQAEEMFSRLVKQLAEKEDVT